MQKIWMLCCLFLIGTGLVRAAPPDPIRFSVAMEIGDLRQATAWLDEGLDPDFEGHTIGTGLMIGAWEGNLPLMELFYLRGADIQHINRFGETALMLAAWKNRKDAVRWLLDHGAQPNRRAHDERAWSALHYAVFAGHADIAETLLAAGADLDARSTNGSTVVMMAAREGHAALARRLLEAGANPTLKNDYGDDAVAWAMRQGHFDIAKSITSAENFAELARQAAQTPQPPPVRSLPAPDQVDEMLRKARFAELEGRGDDALRLYRQAWDELKNRQAPRPVSASTESATEKTRKTRPPKGLVIRAKRGEPARQSISLVPGEGETVSVDALLEQARAAEAAGRPQEAVGLYREAARRIREISP